MAAIKLTALIACFFSLSASAQKTAASQILEPQDDINIIVYKYNIILLSVKKTFRLNN